MTTGQLACQAGHAFTDALELSAPGRHNDSVRPQWDRTKVVLASPSLHHLHRAAALCERLQVPSCFVVDGYDHFLHGPTITAFGFGPVSRRAASKITQGLTLL